MFMRQSTPPPTILQQCESVNKVNKQMLQRKTQKNTNNTFNIKSIQRQYQIQSDYKTFAEINDQFKVSPSKLTCTAINATANDAARISRSFYGEQLTPVANTIDSSELKENVLSPSRHSSIPSLSSISYSHHQSNSSSSASSSSHMSFASISSFSSYSTISSLTSSMINSNNISSKCVSSATKSIQLAFEEFKSLKHQQYMNKNEENEILNNLKLLRSDITNFINVLTNNLNVNHDIDNKTFQNKIDILAKKYEHSLNYLKKQVDKKENNDNIAIDGDDNIAKKENINNDVDDNIDIDDKDADVDVDVDDNDACLSLPSLPTIKTLCDDNKNDDYSSDSSDLSSSSWTCTVICDDDDNNNDNTDCLKEPQPKLELEFDSDINYAYSSSGDFSQNDQKSDSYPFSSDYSSDDSFKGLNEYETLAKIQSRLPTVNHTIYNDDDNNNNNNNIHPDTDNDDDKYNDNNTYTCNKDSEYDASDELGDIYDDDDDDDDNISNKSVIIHSDYDDDFDDDFDDDDIIN